MGIRPARTAPALVLLESDELSIDERKDDHIDICLGRNVSSDRNWWDDVILHHQAIPRCDLDDVDLGTMFLGKRLEAPIIISAMTGGSRKALEYNRMMARAAQDFGIGMGVGSQRAGIEKPEYRPSYEVVKEFQVPLLFGNIGAPQIVSGDEVEKAGSLIASSMEMIGADAVCLHLNYLQEIVQEEGETCVGDLLTRLRHLCGEFPIIAKETGGGISREAASALKEAGVLAIDTGGMSGTSFSAVESYRSPPGKERALRLGRTFWNWGVPTPASVVLSNVGLPLIASGGIRDGLDAAKGLALGADCAGMARKLLAASSKGYGVLEKEIGWIIDEIRAAIFLSGCDSVKAMKGSRAAIIGPTREYLQAIEQKDSPISGI